MDNTTPSSSHAMAVDVATETVVGSHVLTIDGYTKTTAALAVGETIQSDVFRVGGHRWYIECYSCGQDEEGADWVSVFLCLDHHGAANHEVKTTYRFVLLDGAGEEVLSATSRHVQTFSSNDGSWGIAKFIQRKPLDQSYLIIQDDDCCRIRCDVTVTREAPVVPPVPDLHRSHLGDLLLASEVGRDVTFVVGGEQFTAHMCVLAARSSTAFMAVHVGTWKESAGGGGSRHVRVDGIAPSVFKALLRFIYTESLCDDLADHGDRIAVARGLLVAADRYSMDRLSGMLDAFSLEETK